MNLISRRALQENLDAVTLGRDYRVLFDPHLYYIANYPIDPLARPVVAFKTFEPISLFHALYRGNLPRLSTLPVIYKAKGSKILYNLPCFELMAGYDIMSNLRLRESDTSNEFLELETQMTGIFIDTATLSRLHVDLSDGTFPSMHIHPKTYSAWDRNGNDDVMWDGDGDEDEDDKKGNKIDGFLVSPDLFLPQHLSSHGSVKHSSSMVTNSPVNSTIVDPRLV